MVKGSAASKRKRHRADASDTDTVDLQVAGGESHMPSSLLYDDSDEDHIHRPAPKGSSQISILVPRTTVASSRRTAVIDRKDKGLRDLVHSLCQETSDITGL